MTSTVRSTVTSSLSLNEQWLWLVDRLTPGSIARTTATLGRRIAGPLDVERLRRCIADLIQAHETLRTTYVVTGGELRRVVSPDPDPGWIWHDLTSEPEDGRVEHAQRLMDLERTKFIDITKGPQTRCLLVRVSPTEHYMLFATHHLAADAASLILLEEELSARYAQAGREAGEPELPDRAPYAEFVRYQHGAVGGDGAGVTEMSQVLAGVERLDFDAVFGPASERSHGGYSMTTVPEGIAERQQVALGPELSDRVHELMRDNRCSLYMVLLAALELVLHLRSDGRSCLIRSPSANRSRPEHRTMIGALESQTFVRSEVDPRQTFTELLADVRSRVLTSLRHQGVPMSVMLGSLLQRGEPAGRNAAFAGGSVQFALFARGRMAEWPPELQVSVCAGSRIGTASDLQVFAMEEGTRLDGFRPGIVLEANNPGGAYTTRSVNEFLAAYREVIAAVAGRPDVRIESLRALFPPVLPAAQADGGPAGLTAGGPDGPGARKAPAELEQRVLELVRSVRGDDTLGVADSLFGDPRTAVEAAVRLVEAVNTADGLGGARVTLADLLQRPTVAGLAAALAS